MTRSSNECTQAGLPYTKVYANSIGTTIEGVRIQSSGNASSTHSVVDEQIQFLGLTATRSGITGENDEV